MNNKITITMPYYDQPEMLEVQIKVWEQYPDWVKECLEIIVVDDGSRVHPAFDVFPDPLRDIPVSLFQIKENIPWNHGGARNLAFDRMEEGWAVLMDMDHVLPVESICSLLKMELRPEMVYIPARYRMLSAWDWEEINRHSDSFILTREKFWEVGGYDEDFSGYWNGVSGPFRKALKRCSGIIEVDYMYFLMYDTDLIKDAHVTSLGRRGTKYDIRNHKNLALWDVYSKALNKYVPKKVLRFNWEQVI